MKPSYRRYIKKYHRYLIGKGEVAAGNNSKALKDELKKITQQLKRMKP